MRPAIVAGVTAMCLVGSAHAWQIHYRDVALADAVDDAEVLVDAIYRGDGEDHARFSSFEVARVARGPRSLRGHTLVVRSTGYSEMVFARQVFEQSGVRRSPLLDRLTEGSESLTEGERYCVLLDSSTVEGEYELTAAGAHVRGPCRQLLNP